MSETGVVVALHGDQVMVEMEASKDCEACGACRYTSSGRMVTSVRNSLDAGIGDTVMIDIEPKVVVAAALIVYLLPIALFFVGYGLFSRLGALVDLAAEPAGIAGGVVFLIISFFAVAAVDKRAGVSHRFEPKMYEITHKG